MIGLRNYLLISVTLFCCNLSYSQNTATITTFASFNGTNGARPIFIAQGDDGNLYGATYGGGIGYNPHDGGSGGGAIFRITPDGTISNLYFFTPPYYYNDNYGSTAGEGAYISGFVKGGPQSFYGSTTSSGIYTRGSVFKITYSGTFSTLLNCDYTNTGDSVRDIVAANNGILYGLQQYSTENPDGNTINVFEVNDYGVYSLLTYSTNAILDSPGGLMQASDGTFYGVAFDGPNDDGCVFKFIAGQPLTPIAVFTGTNGAYPNWNLVQGMDGNIYGTTYGSGSGSYPHGSVFKLVPGGIVTTLSTFNGLNGQIPAPAFIQASDGNFYGLTLDSINPEGYHLGPTLYQVTSSGKITTLGLIPGSPEGPEVSCSGLIQGNDGNFYGTTQFGGTNNEGSIFKAVVRTSPLLQSIVQTNGLLSFNWNAVSGFNYQVQYQSSLYSTIWTNVGPVINATNGLASASEAVPTNIAQGFYRVVLLP